MEKKMISTSQKFSCLLAIIRFFLENCFPPHSNGFNQQKISSDQKAQSPLDKKSVSTNRMKDLLKNTFPLYGKAASTGIKQYYFQQTKSSFPLAGINDWLENMLQLKEKLLPLAAANCCLRKWKKLVSASQKTSFHQLKYGLFKNCLPLISVTVSTKT